MVICIVDDDLSVLKAMGRLLKSMGFTAETFSSGMDFLGNCKLSTCDCLITDIRMPGMNGFELWGKLAKLGSKIPVIFITAYEDPRAHEKAMEEGAVAYLQKPLDDQVLLDAIDMALKQNSSGKFS